MPDQPEGTQDGGGDQDVAVQSPPIDRKETSRQPQKTPPKLLPQYKVLLHNDDVNEFEYVIRTVCRVTSLSVRDAELRAAEADQTGVALLLVTHKERAELYQEQFTSAVLTVTIEPAGA